MMSSITNPMPTVDDWAVLSDGSVALIRGRDYHIDWKRPDGSVASSPKISYDWQRLSDDDKVAVIDSAKKAIEAMRATNARRDSTGRGGDLAAKEAAMGGAVRTTIVMGGGDAMIGGA